MEKEDKGGMYLPPEIREALLNMKEPMVYDPETDKAVPLRVFRRVVNEETGTVDCYESIEKQPNAVRRIDDVVEMESEIPEWREK